MPEVNEYKGGIAGYQSLHHVTLSHSAKGGVTFRVRICKTCSKHVTQLELGTYNDQETAILVNDINEMNEGRFENLHLLCPFDGPFLRLFRGYKWVRGERVDIGFIHELVSSRVTSVGGPTSSPLAKREPRERKNVSKFGSEIAPEKKKKKKKRRRRKRKGGRFRRNDGKAKENRSQD